MKTRDLFAWPIIGIAILAFAGYTGLDDVRAKQAADRYLLNDTQVSELRIAQATDQARFVGLLAQYYGAERN